MTALVEAPAITLRWYQESCVNALFDWFETKEGSPLAVLPTGSGKSAVLSAFIARARDDYPPFRALVLATQAELVKQNAKAASLFVPKSEIGLYSAGLKERDASKPVTIANIQSLAKHAYAVDPFDVILIDEAQTIADADSGLYRTFLKAQQQLNPNVRMVGLTATPYKLSSGRLDQGANALFAGVAYEAPVLRLIEEGYLCRPIVPRTALHLDTSNVAVRGDFVAKALAEAVDLDAITSAAADEVCERFKDRKKWLIFACSIDHARHIAQALSDRGVPAGVVHGELPMDERAHRLAAFSSGELRALCNANLLTTGYDEPAVDAIALLRPTKSPGLYAQMLGRGMRVHLSKSDCLVLDFGRNIELHGPIDALVVKGKGDKDKREGAAPAKLCPSCETYVAAGLAQCHQCGHQFPPPPVVLESVASAAPILSSDRTPTYHTITSVQYTRNAAKPPKSIDTLRVEYYAGYKVVAREWVCIEHEGFARQKAEQWWASRSSERCPRSLDEALALADDLRKPTRIGLLPDPANPRYDRITHYEWPGQRNGLPRACWTCTHWAEGDPWAPNPTPCTKWNEEPPPDIQKTGCDEWAEDTDTLPF